MNRTLDVAFACLHQGEETTMKKFAIAAASLFVLSGVAACGESAADKAAEKRK